jgi:hypothetical protein
MNERYTARLIGLGFVALFAALLILEALASF